MFTEKDRKMNLATRLTKLMVKTQTKEKRGFSIYVIYFHVQKQKSPAKRVPSHCKRKKRHIQQKESSCTTLKESCHMDPVNKYMYAATMKGKLH